MNPPLDMELRGEPTMQIQAVRRRGPVDTSPMEFECIRLQDRIFKFRPPLRLNITRDDETGSLYVASDDELGIHAYAETREQLAHEIAEQVAFNWDEYAQEAPDKLARGALRLRESMRARVEEIHA
jgi:hypothetical protein